MLNKGLKVFIPVAAVIAGILYLCTAGEQERVPVVQPDHDVVPQTAETSVPATSGTDSGIWVYISGSVENPGVYCLEKGSRLFEALEMAGGTCPDASLDAVNLALVLEDGQHVFIPGADDPQTADTGIGNRVEDGLVNINTASSDELKTLPGIGDSKAQAIIAYREKTPFRSIEEIMNVSGIKENSFEKIKDRIKV